MPPQVPKVRANRNPLRSSRGKRGNQEHDCQQMNDQEISPPRKEGRPARLSIECRPHVPPTTFSPAAEDDGEREGYLPPGPGIILYPPIAKSTKLFGREQEFSRIHHMHFRWMGSGHTAPQLRQDVRQHPAVDVRQPAANAVVVEGSAACDRCRAGAGSWRGSRGHRPGSRPPSSRCRPNCGKRCRA